MLIAVTAAVSTSLWIQSLVNVVRPGSLSSTGYFLGSAVSAPYWALLSRSSCFTFTVFYSVLVFFLLEQIKWWWWIWSLSVVVSQPKDLILYARETLASHVCCTQQQQQQTALLYVDNEDGFRAQVGRRCQCVFCCLRRRHGRRSSADCQNTRIRRLLWRSGQAGASLWRTLCNMEYS